MRICTPRDHSRFTECNIQSTIYNKTVYTINRILFIFVKRPVDKFLSAYLQGLWTPRGPARNLLHTLALSLSFFFCLFLKLCFVFKFCTFLKSIYNCWFCAERAHLRLLRGGDGRGRVGGDGSARGYRWGRVGGRGAGLLPEDNVDTGRGLGVGFLKARNKTSRSSRHFSWHYREVTVNVSSG